MQAVQPSSRDLILCAGEIISGDVLGRAKRKTEKTAAWAMKKRSWTRTICSPMHMRISKTCQEEAFFPHMSQEDCERTVNNKRSSKTFVFARQWLKETRQNGVFLDATPKRWLNLKQWQVRPNWWPQVRKQWWRCHSLLWYALVRRDTPRMSGLPLLLGRRRVVPIHAILWWGQPKGLWTRWSSLSCEPHSVWLFPYNYL